MRPFREFKTFLDDKAIMKIGSLDKKGDRVIYLMSTFWITPHTNLKSYEEDVKYFNKEFSKLVSYFVEKNNFFSKRYIIDFDCKINYMKYEKKSYVSIEVFFAQNSKHNLKEINDLIYEDSKNMIYSILSKIENKNYTIFAKSKKRRQKKLEVKTA